MSDVTITVRGENEARLAPERATIHVTVRQDGPQRTAVVEQAMRLAEPIRKTLTDRKDAGTVTEWTSKRLFVRAERPWNSSGTRLAPVHHASIDFTATFSEASELSLWASDISAWDGVEVGWVHWHLTPQTRAQVEREVAASAVGVAVARAEAYAGALGMSSVTPLEIADVGLISRGDAPPASAVPRMATMRGRAGANSAPPAMEYEPEEIVISATVEARFNAR